jgi:hypothetical protein
MKKLRKYRFYPGTYDTIWYYIALYWGTMLQAGRPRVRDSMKWISSIYLILPAAMDPGDHSVSNRNEYQKQKIMFLGNRAWPVRRANNLAAICEPIA